MEPVTSPIESIPEAKSSKSPERVTLGEVEAEKVDRWLKQLQEATRGFLALTRSDLVRVLIRMHRDELAASEIKQLRADHYDPIRHIQWITPQIKAALAIGDSARVGELQEELRGIQLAVGNIAGGSSCTEIVNGSPKRGRRRTKKADQSEVVGDQKTP